MDSLYPRKLSGQTVNLLRAFMLIISIGVSSSCNEPLERAASSLLSDTWQSSSFNNSQQYCGVNKSFHSKLGASSADQGFHWLVMKLIKPTVVTSVKMRPGIRISGSGTPDDFQSRSEGIEVWMSSINIEFGSEKCNSQNTSLVFKSTFDSWYFCGKTTKGPTDGSVIVRCAARYAVSFILLRKSVSDVDRIERQAMSFERLNLLFSTVNVEIEPSKPIKQGSSFTVRCNTQKCTDCTSNKVKLCNAHTNSCLPEGNLTYHIENAQPSHSANYTCSVHHQVLSVVNVNVLYPPTNVQVFIDESRCSAHSDHVRFTFYSSDSHPLPHHNCTAFDSHGNSITLNRIDSAYKSDGIRSVRSHWECLNCSRESNVTLMCTAVQHTDLDNGSRILLWRPDVEQNLNSPIKKYCESQRLHHIQISASLVTILLIAVIFSTAILYARKRKSEIYRAKSSSSIAAAVFLANLPPRNQTQESEPDQMQISAEFDEPVQFSKNTEEAVIYNEVIPRTQITLEASKSLESIDQISSSSRVSSEATIYLDIVGDT